MASRCVRVWGPFWSVVKCLRGSSIGPTTAGRAPAIFHNRVRRCGPLTADLGAPISMRAAIECIYQDTTISIAEALTLRNQHGKNLSFSCIECGELLRAHRAGENIAAHFEHHQRNNSCSFSAGPVSAYTGVGFLSNYEIDDIRAIEGYEIDRKLITHARNSNLVTACKARNNYKCEACGFKLELHGKYVIECHHINPVAISGEREVSINELVCLCPTCHRIAHTRKEPLTVPEIRHARGLT